MRRRPEGFVTSPNESVFTQGGDRSRRRRDGLCVKSDTFGSAETLIVTEGVRSCLSDADRIAEHRLDSSSGIQVITLGVALAVLVVAFYGLSIGCAIRRKKQQPKPETPK